jgi:hypothetical protein
MLRRWVKELGSDPTQAFRGLGQMKPELVGPNYLRTSRCGFQRQSHQYIAIAAISQADAAKMLNVCVDSIQRAAVIRDHGIAELQEKVAKGEVAPSTAAGVAWDEKWDTCNTPDA